jgi:hypothetical protein
LAGLSTERHTPCRGATAIFPAADPLDLERRHIARLRMAQDSLEEAAA